jgi:hypothetical protein
LLEVVNEVLKDEGFHLETQQVSAALQAASSLIEWSRSSANVVQFSLFSQKLVQYFEEMLTWYR